MPWFEILMGIASIFYLLCGIYNWFWYWKLARNKLFRNWLGEKNSRLAYMIVGIAGLSMALSDGFYKEYTWHWWLSFFRWFMISALVTAILFYSHENQSIVDFMRDKDKAE